MTIMPSFDTLKFQQKLSEVMDPKVATAITDAFAEATTNLSSKADLEVMRADIRSEIRSGNADVIKWAIGSQIVLVALLFAAIKLT
jgi:hypothetical protein